MASSVSNLDGTPFSPAPIAPRRKQRDPAIKSEGLPRGAPAPGLVTTPPRRRGRIVHCHDRQFRARPTPAAATQSRPDQRGVRSRRLLGDRRSRRLAAAAPPGRGRVITTLAGPFRLRPQKWRTGNRGHLGRNCSCVSCSEKRRLQRLADTAPAADTGAARRGAPLRNPSKSATARVASGES